MAQDDSRYSQETTRQFISEPLPLRILVLGNFSGEALQLNTHLPQPQNNRFPTLNHLNHNNLDAFFASLNIDLQIDMRNFFSPHASSHTIRFKPHSISDFTPRGLLESVPEFRSLQNIQDKLQELSSGSISETQFLSLLNQHRYIGVLKQLHRFIETQAGSTQLPGEAHSVSSNFAVMKQLLKRTAEAAISDFLHHPQILSLESLWRGLKFLVDRTNFQLPVQIDCINTSADDVIHSIEHFVFQQPDNKNNVIDYNAIIYTFPVDNSQEHLHTLEKLAGFAELIQTPVLFYLNEDSFLSSSDKHSLTGVKPEILFDRPDLQQWNTLRSRNSARWLVALCNRFLLRNQYEAGMRNSSGITEHIDTPQQRLWGNPVFAVASLMTQSFARTGWPTEIQGRINGKITDLPMYSCQTADGLDVLQTLEHSTTLQQAEEFATAGITLLACTADEDCAYVYYLPCLFEPGKPGGDQYLQISGATNNLPYQLILSRFARAIQGQYHKLSKTSNATALQRYMTYVLQDLLESTGQGNQLKVSVSTTDEEDRHHIVNIHAVTGNRILGQSEIDFEMMV